MENQRICIVPDVHQQIYNVEKLIDKEKYDKVIFLSDFCDSYLKPPFVASFENTCLFLRHLLIQHPRLKDFKFLLSNHDLAYIYRNNKPYNSSVHKTPNYYCSGISSNKVSTFRKVFYSEGLRDDFFINRYDLAIKINGWIFSHAGIIPQHLSYGSNIDSFIKYDCRQAWVNFRDRNHPRNYLLTDIGERRGGENQCGGILWLDYKSEFYGSVDIGKQIFGHSHVETPTVNAEGTEYESWCLDDGQNSYAILENNKVTIKKYSDL